MGLKVSAYVHEYELGAESVLLGNILWRSFLELSQEDARTWQQYRNIPNTLPEPLRGRLVEKKMLIDQDLDEARFISQRYDENRFSGAILGLTIAPTIDCNLACLYCYEQKRPGRMSPEVEKALIDYVHRQLPGRSKLSVTWYGGEPLICKESIYRLTEAFLDVCRTNGCTYKAFMVTNGYLLTPEVVDRLAALGHWQGIQITLDGHAPTHDEKRPTRAGRPSFQTIWHHLLYAAGRLPMLVRMNVDLRNPEGCHALLEQLAEANLAQTGLKVYFAPIHPFGKGCQDIQEKEGLQLGDNAVFADIEVRLVQRAVELGFSTRFKMEGPWLTQCQSVSTHTLLVEPDGSLQRCWIEVGEDDKRVGHISQSLELTSENNMRWLRFDPTRNEPCRSCEVLPLCFGGCPQRHVDGAPPELTCNEIRYNLKEMVLLEYMTRHRACVPLPILQAGAAPSSCSTQNGRGCSSCSTTARQPQPTSRSL